MLSRIARTAVLAAAVTAAGSPAHAAGRDNPFLPQSTPAEEQQMAARRAMEETVRDMLPEIQQALGRNFDKERRDTLDEVRRLSAAQAAQAAQGARPAPAGQAKPTSNLKLVSCVNGKALYRDQNTNATLYARPGSDAQAPCDPQ